MVYIDRASREKFKADFDAFLARTLTATPVNNAER
jgi:hypothetical protein